MIIALVAASCEHASLSAMRVVVWLALGCAGLRSAHGRRLSNCHCDRRVLPTKHPLWIGRSARGHSVFVLQSET